MIIVLSQKIDTKSSYEGDEIFRTYHYPGRYRNQIHTGDTFVYYQGNRYNKSQRYYFGTGKIGNIYKEDADNYYAELVDVMRFEKKVPIYLPDQGYIEQLGYETVRKSINPPWQSSIRPISEEAYRYIMERSGLTDSISFNDNNLKKAVQHYFINKDPEAIEEIEIIAKRLSELHNL